VLALWRKLTNIIAPETATFYQCSLGASYVAEQKIDDKDLMVLGFISSNTESQVGFNDLLEKCKRGTLGKVRIGSQHTLESRLRKLEARGLIGKGEERHVGRGHKAGYYLTPQGRRLLEDQRSPNPDINFESLELGFLKLLPNVSSVNREITVFSDPALSLVAPKEVVAKLLEKVHGETLLRVWEIEDAFKIAHRKRGAFLRSGQWTDDQRQILEVLRRRYTFQQRRKIRPGGRYPPEVIQMVRTLNEENAKVPNQFTADTLPFALVGKRLDNVPLSRREFRHYQKLVRLERRHEQAWVTMKEPRLALLVCNKRYIDELVVRALLVRTKDEKCEITERFLQRLAPNALLKCQKEFWEATNTDKYIKDLVLSEYDRKGKRVRWRNGAAPGEDAGLSYPLRASFLSLYEKLPDPKEASNIDIPLTIRLRKEYFEKMHQAILKEVRRRKLAPLPHSASATYKDIIQSHRKELQHQHGRCGEPRIKEEALRIEAIFTIPGIRPERRGAGKELFKKLDDKVRSLSTGPRRES